MRLIIDGCCLGRRKTGNETYIRCLLGGILEARRDDCRITVLTTPHSAGQRNPGFDWHEIPHHPFPKRNFLTIPSALKQLRNRQPSEPCLYHATYWTRFWSMPLPVILMIHDISFVSFPRGFKTHERIVYANLVRACALQARHILTVSEFSKREMIERWGLPAEKITVTYEAADPAFVAPQNPPSPGNSEPPYLLYVGNLHPRKNLVRLLEAFIQLRLDGHHDIRLKVVGQKAWLFGDIFESVRKHNLEPYVDFTGYVSQEELVSYYQNATVSVYPSLYEGFGFPVLEAMSCGSPVVTSNTTSIPEVAGDAAILVNPESSEEIASGISRLLLDSDLRQELRRRGFAQAARFSWKRCAEETLQACRQTLAG